MTSSHMTAAGHTTPFPFIFSHPPLPPNGQVLDYFKLPFSAVLVVVDEVALELGQIRLRQTGSPGGHNGLKSIEGHLKTKDYHRLRIGVGGGTFWASSVVCMLVCLFGSLRPSDLTDLSPAS